MPQSPRNYGASSTEPSSPVTSIENSPSNEIDGLPPVPTLVSPRFSSRGNAQGRETVSLAQDSAYPIDPLLRVSSQNVLESQMSLSAQSFNLVSGFLPAASYNNSRKRPHDQFKVGDVGTIDNNADKKIRQDTREDTSLWTTVKNYLKDPESSQEPAVSCCICYTEIAIRGLPSQSPCPWKLSDGWQKVGVTLPCAHILCQECIKNHLRSQHESAREPTCPVCRMSLKHGFCGHTVAARRIPVSTTETADIVPLTLPELPHGKKSLPDDCLPCLRRTVGRYIDTGLNCVIDLIQGEENLPERNIENDPAWATVVGHVQSVLRNFTDSQKIGAHWEYMSPSDQDLRVAFVDDACVAGLAPGVRYAVEDTIVSLHSNDGIEQAYWYLPCPRFSHTLQ